MPFALNAGVRLHYRLDGRAAAPAVVLANSLGTDLALWDPVMPDLTRQFRVLRMDLRGHGASDAPAGEYSLALLGADVLAAMDAAGVSRAHYVGLSIGGMIGQWLALHAPERFDRFVFCCTSSALSPDIWTQRLAMVRDLGMAGLAEPVLRRWFSPEFIAADPPALGSLRATLIATSPVGYSGCCCAIRDMALGERIAAIAAPALVVSGARDIGMPPAQHGDVIAARIPGARKIELDCGHIPPVEAPAVLAAALIGFLASADDGLEPAKALWFERGLEQRRKVLGDSWVDAALARRNSFNAEFQNMITRLAWGEIWTRPGLDHKTRRLLVLAMTIAMGRWEEFKLHVRAGVEQGGFSVDELKEVIHQAAVYCGVPAGNSAMNEAEGVLRAMGRV